jgi:hypothetical protein
VRASAVASSAPPAQAQPSRRSRAAEMAAAVVHTGTFASPMR